MRRIKFRSFSLRSFSKENKLRTGGINEILMSVLAPSGNSQNDKNGREPARTGEISGIYCAVTGADLAAQWGKEKQLIRNQNSVAGNGRQVDVDFSRSDDRRDSQ